MIGAALAASIVVQNLIYPIGAVVLMIIGGVAVTLRHRKPKSVEANMASFNKGLRALAPEAEPAPVARPPVRVNAGPQIRTVHTVLPGSTSPRPVERASDGGGDGRRSPDPHDDPTTEAETG